MQIVKMGEKSVRSTMEELRLYCEKDIPVSKLKFSYLYKQLKGIPSLAVHYYDF